MSLIAPEANIGVTKHFPFHKRAIAMGFVQVGNEIRSIIMAVILPLLVSPFGWPKVRIFPGLVVLVFSFAISKKYPDTAVEEICENIYISIIQFFKFYYRYYTTSILQSVVF